MPLAQPTDDTARRGTTLRSYLAAVGRRFLKALLMAVALCAVFLYAVNAGNDAWGDHRGWLIARFLLGIAFAGAGLYLTIRIYTDPPLPTLSSLGRRGTRGRAAR